MSITNNTYPEGSGSVGARISGLVFSADGSYAYMTNNAPYHGGEISCYSRDANTGALSQVGTSFTCPGAEAVRDLIIHPNGKWLFANADYHVYVFSIATDGSIGTAAVSQATSTNSNRFTISNNGEFIYTLEVLTSNNGANPSAIHSFQFNNETGLLTEQTQFKISTLGNANHISVLNEGDCLAVTSSSIYNQSETGFVTLYSLNTDTGAAPILKQSLATNTKFPYGVFSLKSYVYVLENEQAFLYGAPSPKYCLSCYNLNTTSTTLTEMSNSPVATPIGATLGCITKNNLRIFSTWSFQQNPPRNIYTYAINQNTGALTIDDSVIEANGNPQLISVDPSEHTLYFSTIATSGNGFNSILNIDNSELPYLTCQSDLGISTTTLTCNIGNGSDLNIASASFRYGLSSNPIYNDLYTASINDESFSLNINSNSLQNGKTYYFQAEIKTQDGETIISSLHNFMPKFPQVTGFSPNPVGINKTLTITGSFFATNAAENTVVFTGNKSIAASSASNGSITVEVPEGASSGPISLTCNGEQGLPSTPLTIQLQPTISEINPIIAGVNSTITISGTEFYQPVVNFSGANGPVNAVVQSTSADGTTLTVTVPSDATNGPITISCHGIVSEASEQSFTVQQVPTVTECSPMLVTTGNTLTVKGTNFSSIGNTLVVFQSASSTSEILTETAAISATATVTSATSLQATVPAGAISGEISVVANGVQEAQPENAQNIQVVLTTTSSGLPGSYYYSSASNGNAVLLAIQNAGSIYRSTDNGKSWSAAFTLNSLCQFIPAGVRLTAVYFYKGNFYISAYQTKYTSANVPYLDGFLACSTDGLTWNVAPGVEAPANIGSAVVSGDTLMTVRNYPETQHNSGDSSLYYLTNDTYKYSTIERESGFLTEYGTGGNNKIIYTTNAQKLVSFDASNRATVISNSNFPTNGFRDITWSPLLNLFIVVGSSNFSSSDGDTWGSYSGLPSFSNTGDIATKIASTDKILVIGTLTGCIYATTNSSPTASDWVEVVHNSSGNRVQIVDAYVSGDTILLFNTNVECIEVKLS
ncbi:hypothetical protein NBRC116188_27470 [Oceaniserpentilla sp. 4NH20-0058]|uniref:IPT/TIG domain-containing protein n=1 Tax=Oceaniserpentilla sp. 4NH20-0058 TaxID=3127660 RepID=UPI003106636F